jgi:hypothetical protein
MPAHGGPLVLVLILSVGQQQRQLERFCEPDELEGHDER